MRLIPDYSPAPAEDIGQLITYFVRERGLTEADLQRVVALQRSQELRLGEALLALKLATPDELNAARGYREVQVQAATGRASADMVFVSDPYGPVAEQLRALRTELLLRQKDRGHNCLVILSSSIGDGRSRLAAALAIACAQLEQSTLLVDADLRAPQQHQLFNLPRGPGLADTLARGVAPATQAVEGLPALAVLTAGNAVTNPLELLCSRPFADLLESWRHRYRHVVIDTAAAERGADALTVARAANSAVVLARLHHTALPACADLIKRLRSAGVPLLGSTVSKSRL